MDTPSTTRPLALVTGASSGIGFELARQFLQHNFDVVITAEDDELDTAAARLAAAGDGEIRTIRADLRKPDQVDALFRTVMSHGSPVAVAALNAGVGQGQPFVETALVDQLEVIDLNVRSTVHLAKLLVDDMAARGDGKLLITSSIASTMPGPFQVVYNASKSFVQSFAEGLATELADAGVSVTSLMPGPTDTEFFDRADLGDTPMGTGPKADPAKVAEQGFKAVMDNKRKVVGGGVGTKLQEATSGLLPDAVKAAVHKQMAKPSGSDGSGSDDAANGSAS